MLTDFFVELLGLHAKADTITTSQICCRTAVVLLLAIGLLRVAGRRTFASNSNLEMVVKFMLGGILGRAITADAPFGVTIASAVVLVVLYRLIAYATYFFPALGRLLKGDSSILAEGSVVNHAELRRVSLTEEAVQAAVRGAAHLDDLAATKTVRLEQDGTISVVKKPG